MAASEQIRNHELNESLYRNLPTSIISSIILATILFLYLFDYENPLSLSIWYGAVISVLMIRCCLFAWFNKTNKDQSLQNYHFVLFTIFSSLSASLWGVLGSFLMPDDIFYQTFIIIMVSGILAGATISLSARYLASMLYICLALVPMMCWLALRVAEEHVGYSGIFVGMTIYLFFASKTAHKNAARIAQNIYLKNKNLALLTVLNQHLKQIEMFSNMGEALEQCRNENDIEKVCNECLPKVFPDFEIKIMFISKNPQECDHLHDNTTTFICSPIQTTYEAFGILHLQLKPTQDPQSLEFISSQQALCTRVATTIAFALNTLQYQEHLESVATHDKLTGLYNRRYLDDYFKMEFARAKRKATTIAVLMLDIDHFKLFNDSYGHETGDQVLHQLGAYLLSNVRGSDLASRYGGEEFIVILSDANLDAAKQRADQIREGVKHISMTKDGSSIPHPTISIGVAMFPMQGETQAQVIAAADKALYRAKSEGRDRVCVAG